jgi:hypothetical protein
MMFYWIADAISQRRPIKQDAERVCPTWRSSFVDLCPSTRNQCRLEYPAKTFLDSVGFVKIKLMRTNS